MRAHDRHLCARCSARTSRQLASGSAFHCSIIHDAPAYTSDFVEKRSLIQVVLLMPPACGFPQAVPSPTVGRLLPKGQRHSTSEFSCVHGGSLFQAWDWLELSRLTFYCLVLPLA